MKSRSTLRDQSGQSLIETIAAIFILTMAITAGLALAIYAFSSSTTAQNEIIATNLAREGVEVVRMMRDSNWLAGEATGGAWDLQTCADLPAGKQNCYASAFGGPSYLIAINSGAGGNGRAIFNATNNSWSFDATANYYLYLQADGSYSHTVNGTSIFARLVNISWNVAAPYTVGNPEMIVKSVVAWQGKKCTPFNTGQDLLLALTSPCKVVVEEHLTNWKDY